MYGLLVFISVVEVFVTRVPGRYLVMPLFEGGDLVSKHKEFKNKFSIQTTLLLTLR